MSRDLDQLQSSVERLLALLKDRHPGLSIWNECVNEEVHALTRWADDGGREPER